MCRPSQTPHLPMSSKRLADALIRKQSKLLPLHRIMDRDSRNLVNPFMRVTSSMTRHLATLRES
eukprot:maker-scaffold_15-snap-gene-0.31-mRNA-1 protein AED:0.48 eAED:0.48 QI:0/0/0/1/0/0/2/0/63